MYSRGKSCTSCGLFANFVTGNGDHSSPDSSDGNRSNDTASQKSNHKNPDWREFRANLFAREQVLFFHLLPFFVQRLKEGIACLGMSY